MLNVVLGWRHNMVSTLIQITPTCCVSFYGSRVLDYFIEVRDALYGANVTSM